MALMRRGQMRRSSLPELRERDFWTAPFSDIFERWMGEEETPSFQVDMADEGDHYVLRAELPGVKPDDVRISVDNDVLTIVAEKKDEFEGREKGIYRHERSFGKLTRSFQLNNLVNDVKIEAEYRDGVLSLSLPKREESKGHIIPVKAK